MGASPPCCVAVAAGFPSLQIALVALHGLLDAQQEGRVPLVQAGDGVVLLHLQPAGRDAEECLIWFFYFGLFETGQTRTLIKQHFCKWARDIS